MQNEMGLTKTDRVLMVVLKLLEREDHWIEEQEFFQLLGDPSSSQRYKLLNDLTTTKNDRPPIFVRHELNQSQGYALSNEMRNALGV